jgi:hypothetical protein
MDLIQYALINIVQMNVHNVDGPEISFRIKNGDARKSERTLGLEFQKSYLSNAPKGTCIMAKAMITATINDETFQSFLFHNDPGIPVFPESLLE